MSAQQHEPQLADATSTAAATSAVPAVQSQVTGSLYIHYHSVSGVGQKSGAGLQDCSNIIGPAHSPTNPTVYKNFTASV